MRRPLTYVFCLLAWLSLAFPGKADVPWRIPNYSSYVELKDGTVLCGDKYDSWHEGRTGNVCAGGQYDSWHEGRTGEVACGGQYDSWHEGRTGNVCAGGQYDSWHEGRTGEVACGGQYDSWHEGRTGNVCAGGQYDSWHEGRTGEVACGGKYTSLHKSPTGKVCFGGLYQPASFSDLNLDAPSRETTGTTARAAQQATKLMIFGGENHKAYLGCLICSEYEPDSVKNKFGENGSPYSSDSIWNHYSE